MAPIDEFVREMHTRSGLLALIEASTITPEDAGARTLAFLKEHIVEPRTVPLCGNSLGTDRRFLARWYPEIEDYLHYRSVDVSTLKELARRWQPDVRTNAPKKARGHRALDDIRESLDELRYYRTHLFRGASILSRVCDRCSSVGCQTTHEVPQAGTLVHPTEQTATARSPKR